MQEKRQSVSRKMSETVSERKTEAERIHGLRRDVETRQRDLEKAQEELQKAQENYGDLRKRFKPKPPAKKKGFWGRLFSRGGNGGNG